jgi:hypothetical protein
MLEIVIILVSLALLIQKKCKPPITEMKYLTSLLRSDASIKKIDQTVKLSFFESSWNNYVSCKWAECYY